MRRCLPFSARERQHTSRPQQAVTATLRTNRRYCHTPSNRSTAADAPCLSTAAASGAHVRYVRAAFLMTILRAAHYALLLPLPHRYVACRGGTFRADMVLCGGASMLRTRGLRQDTVMFIPPRRREHTDTLKARRSLDAEA